MKKVLTIICMLAVAFGVSAQSFEKDYTYGFWSNWSVGGSVDFTKSLSKDTWTIGQGSDFGFDLRLYKQFAERWNVRLIGSVPALVSSDTLQFDRYATATAGVGYHFTKHFYGFADGGLVVKGHDFGWLALYGNAGLGLDFKVCNNCTLFGELGVDCVADFTPDAVYDNAYVKVGAMYDFGPTKLDKAMIEQRKALVGEFTQDTITALNDRIDAYVKNEKLLMEHISVLEMHDSSLHVALADVSEERDSLRNVIQSITDNQLNYYALPFSVLFDNDSYTINSTENAKIKAVANIMKQDTSVHYTVAGFCDHTGSQAYNQKLSDKRAESVKKALIRYGVKEEQIDVAGHGKDAPFSDSKLSVNRRVSFYRNF